MKSVQKRNDAFSKMSAPERRVAIAKDVLKQIALEKYRIREGHWLTVEEVDLSQVEEKLESMLEKLREGKVDRNYMLGKGVEVNLAEKIATPEPECTCCAIGAACASSIRLFNKHELQNFEVEDYDQGQSILSDYFPLHQLDMIEAAFEMRSEEDLHDTATQNQLDAAVEFGEEYADPLDRARAIFSNIVKNKGTFKP